MLTQQVYNLSGLDRVEEIPIHLIIIVESVKKVVVKVLVMVVGMFISSYLYEVPFLVIFFHFSHY